MRNLPVVPMSREVPARDPSPNKDTRPSRHERMLRLRLRLPIRGAASAARGRAEPSQSWPVRRPATGMVCALGCWGGDFMSGAVELIDTCRRTGRRILVDSGGVRPRRGRDLKGRCLTFAEREEIALRRVQGQSLRKIGTAVGKSASTISRELRRNNVVGVGYRATSAHALAYERADRHERATHGLLAPDHCHHPDRGG